MLNMELSDLKLTRKGIEKKREEDKSTAIVETGCICAEVIEHASQDECHYDVEQGGSNGKSGISQLPGWSRTLENWEQFVWQGL